METLPVRGLFTQMIGLRLKDAEETRMVLGDGAGGFTPALYSLYSYDQLAFDPAAQAIFTVIDTNADGYVCFKYYPNGPHGIHLGNLVDNKAAPHQ